MTLYGLNKIDVNKHSLSTFWCFLEKKEKGREPRVPPRPISIFSGRPFLHAASTPQNHERIMIYTMFVRDVAGWWTSLVIWWSGGRTFKMRKKNCVQSPKYLSRAKTITFGAEVMLFMETLFRFMVGCALPYDYSLNLFTCYRSKATKIAHGERIHYHNSILCHRYHPSSLNLPAESFALFLLF